MIISNQKADIASFYYYSLIYKLRDLPELAKDVEFLKLVPCDIIDIAGSQVLHSVVLNSLFSNSKNSSRKNVGLRLVDYLSKAIDLSQISPIKAANVLVKMHRERLLPSRDRFKVLAIHDNFVSVVENQLSEEYAYEALRDYLNAKLPNSTSFQNEGIAAGYFTKHIQFSA